MNILITGGIGFIGANLVKKLKKNNNHKIVIVDNFSTGSSKYLKNYKVKIYKGDIKNYKFLEKCFNNIDCVIHLAGHTRVVDSIKNPMYNFKENLIGTLNLLDISRRKKVKNFIFSSSGGALMDEKRTTSSEKMLPSPTSPYGASKLSCEAYCMSFSKSYSMNIKCLRFSNVYGPESWHKDSIVATLFKNILKNKITTIYGDGTQTRDFVYVGDICSAIIRLINYKYNGIVNIGAGKSYNLKQLIKKAKKITKYKLKIKNSKFRKGEIRKAQQDISKVASLIKFKANYNFEEGLKKTWEWFVLYNKKKN